MEVKCPSCGSLKVYKSFKDKKTKVKINICDSCYFIYQPPCQDLDYYKIKCTTTKVLDLEKHSQDTADYIFNFSKKFINSPNSILEIGAGTGKLSIDIVLLTLPFTGNLVSSIIVCFLLKTDSAIK